MRSAASFGDICSVALALEPRSEKSARCITGDRRGRGRATVVRSVPPGANEFMLVQGTRIYCRSLEHASLL